MTRWVLILVICDFGGGRTHLVSTLSMRRVSDVPFGGLAARRPATGVSAQMTAVRDCILWTPKRRPCRTTSAEIAAYHAGCVTGVLDDIPQSPTLCLVFILLSDNQGRLCVIHSSWLPAHSATESRQRGQSLIVHRSLPLSRRKERVFVAFADTR